LVFQSETSNNCKEYQKQASAFLDFEGENPVELKYNSEWHDKLNFREVLDLTSNFTADYMFERDMFQERKKQGKPIYLHEFLYPVMQAYDSVAMDVDGEVGGNDQTFNMMAGRDLMKSLKKKEKFVLTMKLLTDTTGKKMGKSEGNMIALDDTPEDMFGKVMSWSDEMIVGGFDLCTNLSADEVKGVEKELADGVNPRDLKIRLAQEIVRAFLQDEAAVTSGTNHFVATFSKKEIPDEMPELKPAKYEVVEVLVEAGICKSKGEARRAVDQGGVKINSEKVDEKDYVAIVDPGDIVQKGSRFFVKIK